MHTTTLKPKVGMPVTINIGSDTYAAEVVRVTPSLKSVWVEYLPVSGAEPMKFMLKKSGTYRDAGGCRSLTLGVAKDYRDPSI